MRWRQHISPSSPCCSQPPAAQPCPPREVVGLYDRLVQCGTLREDVHQKHVIQQLAQLQHAMKTYSNSTYLSLLSSTLHSNDGKSHPTLDKDPPFIPADTKGNGSIYRVTKNSSSGQLICPFGQMNSTQTLNDIINIPEVFFILFYFDRK